jgi:hypothetical protein
MTSLLEFGKYNRTVSSLIAVAHLFLFCSKLYSGTKPTPQEDVEELQRAEKTAVERYPDLAVSSSSFNKAFLAAVKVFRERKPEFFSQADWPLRLSDAVAKDLKVSPIFSLDSAPIREMAEDARAHHALELCCVQVVKSAIEKYEVHGGAKDWIEGENKLRSTRITDGLTLAAAQADEQFDGTVHQFLSEVLSSSASQACAENKDWIEGLLWTRSTWRCLDKYNEQKQCGIVSRLLAKCASSTLVIDWIRFYGSAFARSRVSRSFLSESQLASNKPPEYGLRATICSQIINDNYHIGGTVVQKRGFLTAANHAKMWSIYRMVPVSDWALIDNWEGDSLSKWSTGVVREVEGDLSALRKHFQRAIDVRLKTKDSVTQPVLPSFEAFIVYEFCDFADSVDGLKWIEAMTRKVASSPDPSVRSAAKILRVFEAAARDLAGAKN